MVERIRRIASGGNPSDRDRVRDADIRAALPGAISAALKMEILSTNYQIDGGSIPDGIVIATFEKQPVSFAGGNRSRVKLPVAPMLLPERIGVFSVYPSGYPEREFIPIPAGLVNMWLSDHAVSTIRQGIYSWEQKTITVYEDLIAAGVEEVDIKICCVSPDVLEDNDPLPLPAELEEAVITSVLQILNVMPRTERNESMQPNPKPAEQ